RATQQERGPPAALLVPPEERRSARSARGDRHRVEHHAQHPGPAVLASSPEAPPRSCGSRHHTEQPVILRLSLHCYCRHLVACMCTAVGSWCTCAYAAIHPRLSLVRICGRSQSYCGLRADCLLSAI